MAGFEESGLPGKQSIRNGFQECTDLETYITSFQFGNNILLTSLHPALHLLDLQDVKRVNFHQTIMSELNDRLIEKINKDCSEEKLKELLDHIFNYIHIDMTRPVIMNAMKKLKDIKEEYIDVITANEKIYKDCPVEVKRRVWMRKHPLFGDAVGPILNKYIEEKHILLYTIERINIRNFFSLPPRQRRQKAFVKELVTMIGSSVDLYNLVLQFLRTLFIRTKEEHYCSLRGELLMAFHDADVKEIRQVDPCHKFTWCLDACIRDKSIDSKRLKELQTFLDGIKKGQEEVMGDIAMILCDPYATNTVVASIIQQLNKLIKMDLLPRSSSELMFLIRLLTLSSGAWNMIKTQTFEETPLLFQYYPAFCSNQIEISRLHTNETTGFYMIASDYWKALKKGPLQGMGLNPDLITKFLPMLLSVMLDNIHATSNNWNINIPESLWNFIRDSHPAQVIFSFFVGQLISNGKRVVLEAVLPHLARALKSQPINSMILNLIIHNSLRHIELFSQTSYCILLFDQFLFVWKEYEHVLHHTLRLLWSVHEKIDRQELVRLLTATQPSSQHSETVHELHSRLVDLIASSKVSTPSSNEQNNSLSPALQLSPAGFSPGIITA